MGNTGEAISCYWIGQLAIKHLEKFLWLLEKCSQWGLPQDDGKEMSLVQPQPQLVRPLPWILFFPTLALLRLYRETVSCVMVLRGGDPYTAAHMVKYFQNQRRSLRAVKYHGIRYRRLYNQTHPNQDTNAFGGYLTRFTQWFNSHLPVTNSDGDTSGIKDDSLAESNSSPAKSKQKISTDEEDKKKEEEKEVMNEDQGASDDEGIEKENDFDPDVALKSLATNDFGSDTEDSDYSEHSDSESSSGDSYSEEATDEEPDDLGIQVSLNGKRIGREIKNVDKNVGEDGVILVPTKGDVESEEKTAMEKLEVELKGEDQEKKADDKTPGDKKGGKGKKKGKSKGVKKPCQGDGTIEQKAMNGCTKEEKEKQMSKEVKESKTSNSCTTDSRDKQTVISSTKACLERETIMQVEHTAQRVQTLLPIYKAESTYLAHSVHKSQPITGKNKNGAPLNGDERPGKPSIVEVTETLIETEVQFGRKVGNATVIKKEAVDSAKQSEAVQDQKTKKRRHVPYGHVSRKVNTNK